jgi:environmental stress-induced protein Ves
MPWKNGGGVTTEIAVAPEGAGLSEFDWRISMATVAEAGPFSAFPGCERSLSILKGSALQLEVAGDAVTLTPASAPYAFAADVPTSGAPVGGPITDLNVMTRRGRFSHRVTRVTDAQSVTIRPAGSPSLLIVRKASLVDDGAEALDVEAGGAVLFDAPWVGGAAIACAQGVDAYLIELFPV